MSRKENLISELHPRKGTWKIAVCIIDMWDVKKHNVRQAIDMVLIDQTEVERPEIHANVHVITEIADIISGIAPRHTLVGSGSQSQYTSNSQRSDRDKFLHNAQMVSLGDISRLREDCFCLIVAMVDEVLIDTPWSYVSYPNCTTTFDPLKIMGVCRSCQNQVSHTVPR
ncbi:hypothetical protein JHK85_023240 [Glycine max]|nr:hypothetical protein JHK85_023240 [Glycine max]